MTASLGGGFQSGELRLLCVNLESPPVFSEMTDGRPRQGYEVDVATSIASRLGLDVTWEVRAWADMIPSLLAGAAHAILCGQGVTEERRKSVEFTRPYAIFDEAVLMRRGEAVADERGLAGKRVLAIAGSTNFALGQSFDDIDLIAFTGTENVLGDMVQMLLDGEVDAVIDDEVVCHPICEEHELVVAFAKPTANQWALAVDRSQPELLKALDRALAEVIADGELRSSWERWMPQIPWPTALEAQR